MRVNQTAHASNDLSIDIFFFFFNKTHYLSIRPRVSPILANLIRRKQIKALTIGFESKTFLFEIK